MNSRILMVCTGLLIPATALAQSDDGVCRADDTNPIAALEVPATIAMPHARVSLCDAPPLFTFSADLNVAVATFSIPLASLPTAPMTPAQFADSIAKVEMPAPWGLGSVTWSVKNGALQISAPVEPNAWGPVEGHLGLTLKSGQYVLVDIATPSLIADDDANVRAGLQGSIVADLDMIQHDKDGIARANAELANPAAFPYAFGGQSVLVDAQQHLDAVDAAIAAMRPALAAAWTAATPQNRAVAYWYLGNRSADIAPLVPQIDAAVNAIAAATNDADRAKALADFQALDAKASAIVDAHGLRDTLLAGVQLAVGKKTGDADFDALIRSRSGWKQQVDSLTAEAAAERAQHIANLKAGLPKMQQALIDDQTHMAAAQKQLADPTPHRRSVTTGYDAGCKTTETAKR